MSNLPITYSDVVAAHQRLAGVAHRTPTLTSPATANALAGASVFFKCENFQRVGAFKFRGAYNAIAQFSPRQKAAGVITFSSGNHAQAIALSARLQRIKSLIVMPGDAPAVNMAAHARLRRRGDLLRPPSRGSRNPWPPSGGRTWLDAGPVPTTIRT